MMRTNGHLGPASVTVAPWTLPEGPGAATQDLDFSLLSSSAHPTWITTWPADTWQLKDGTFGQNQGFSRDSRSQSGFGYSQNDVWLNILQSTNLGDKYFNLQLSNPKGTDIFLLGGENIPLGVALGRSLSEVQIVDSHRNHGVFSFSAPSYITGEGTNAAITVFRTGGSDGSVYRPICHFRRHCHQRHPVYRHDQCAAHFGPGITNRLRRRPHPQPHHSDGDTTVNLRLFTPTGRRLPRQPNQCPAHHYR